ncbi:MAG: UbiD family decarboxylase [Dehalococcoidia bacterium]|nr:UbiD family decarboxylase [Dehalococcoidia bacterium]
MAYFKDLREHIQGLEKAGKLIRIPWEINKDTEMHPLMRLQFRGLPEEERKAFLFENIVDNRGRKFDIPVVCCTFGASREIYALGLQCKPEEIGEKWTQAQLNPIKTKTVASGPVQEEVHVGDTLMEHGALDEFPIPISTPGYDPAPFMSSPFLVTKDPETGIPNVGTYRIHVKSPTRTGANFAPMMQKDAGRNWLKCREMGIPMEAAIVIGAAPNIGYVSVAKFPYEVNELEVAGGLAGEPVEVVKCKTVDLEVPAHAEIVVEGIISTAEIEPEAPFGEAAGYIGVRDMGAFMNVTCITHRKKPIWQAFLSQFPPSESSKIRQIGYENAIFKRLKYDMKLTTVQALACHESCGSVGLFVIQFKDPKQEEVWQALETVGRTEGYTKLVVAVDHDINPWDADAVNWAIALRMQPHRDTKIINHRLSAQDHSGIPPGEPIRDPSLKVEIEGSRLLIDATMKWPYPPVSLPKKEFMEHAIELWEKAGLPALKLKDPWWGYNLGYWTEENEEEAALALKGEYYKTGEKLATRRKPSQEK